MPIGREIHVARRQRLAEGAAHRLFAEMLHVERGLALALRHLHARVEAAQRHHVAQAFEQLLVGEQAGPRADRLAVAVQHADDRKRHVADGARIDIDLGARHRAGIGDRHVGEVRRPARPHLRFRHMKPQHPSIGHDHGPPICLAPIFAHPRGRHQCQFVGQLPDPTAALGRQALAQDADMSAKFLVDVWRWRAIWRQGCARRLSPDTTMRGGRSLPASSPLVGEMPGRADAGVKNATGTRGSISCSRRNGITGRP